jgi:hypothetical protein
MTSSVATHMILDVVGYLKASAVTPVTSTGADRVLDTRTPSGLRRGGCPPGAFQSGLTPNGNPICTDNDLFAKTGGVSGQITVCVVVGGAAGDYAITNATITSPSGSGFATVHASTADWRASSTNNFTAGASLPNLTITRIGADGQICMTSSVATHMILDVVGYLNASAVTPVTTPGADRVLDTRR